LQRKKRVLSRQGQRLDQQQTGWRKVWFMIKPFLFLFGFVFGLLSLLIFVSMLLTNIDKAANAFGPGNSTCRAACGFVLDNSTIFNPLNVLFTYVSAYFPLDYVLIGCIIFYIFFATLSGVTEIGVRFLWVNLYKIRRASSPPQGLLLTAIILMLSVLSLNMEITTLAPQYATWGSQTYFSPKVNKTIPCDFNSVIDKDCYMTQISSFVNSISVRTSFFGVIFYAATWLFLVCFLIGLVIALIRGKASNIEARDDDSDEEEN